MTARLRIMLADDHQAVRQGLRALFDKEADVEVVDEAADVAGTMEGVRRSTPDVLLLDLSMPPTGGLNMIPTLKRQSPRTAVVVLTRFREVAFVREAMSAGASGYVLKQSPFREVKRAAMAAAAGEQYVDALLKPEVDDPPMEPGGPSPREREVLRRTALGQSNKEIAADLGISVKTVEVHKTQGMRKLALPDRGGLVRYAVLQGWLTEP
jgi:two-component system response regulator NreC